VVEQLWQKRMLNGAAALHVGAEEEARTIADIAIQVPRVILPFGISWQDYADMSDGRQFRRQRLAGHDGPIVMNVGRIAAKKGLDILIRAFALVSSRVHDAKLVIVGPDNEGLGPSLQSLAIREGIGGQVVFTGMLHGEQLREALAAADVWVLPSKAEAFPMAVMEALAAGRPIVISPGVNTAAEIAAANAGIVCKAEPAPLAAEIASLLGDDERRTYLQARAREFARRFDWATIAPNWVRMYEEIAEAA
jgi:glycosyltransferase involved in cell wall biosynthesis